MKSTRGWIGGNSYDSYGDEISDVHILSNFLKVKLIGVPFRDMYFLLYLSPLIVAKHLYFSMISWWLIFPRRDYLNNALGRMKGGSFWMVSACVFWISRFYITVEVSLWIQPSNDFGAVISSYAFSRLVKL